MKYWLLKTFFQVPFHYIFYICVRSFGYRVWRDLPGRNSSFSTNYIDDADHIWGTGSHHIWDLQPGVSSHPDGDISGLWDSLCDLYKLVIVPCLYIVVDDVQRWMGAAEPGRGEESLSGVTDWSGIENLVRGRYLSNEKFYIYPFIKLVYEIQYSAVWPRLAIQRLASWRSALPIAMNYWSGSHQSLNLPR